MDEEKRLRALSGRQAVEAYRLAHRTLYAQPWHRGIPDEHTPLLNTLLNELKQLGFDSLEGFFDASEEINIQELGFTSKADFDARATEADRVLLEEKWK